MKFLATFDKIGIMVSVAAVLILLYGAIMIPNFAQDYWVAFAFWAVGFMGSISLGLTKREKKMTFSTFMLIVVGTAVVLGMFLGINTIYAVVASGDILSTTKIVSFAVGVCEELFFGVFLLGVLINWVGLNPVIAIMASAGVHSAFHIPNWGSDPRLLILFFVVFAAARSVYVFAAPYVGVIVAAHGFWNLGVTPNEVLNRLETLKEGLAEWVLQAVSRI